MRHVDSPRYTIRETILIAAYAYTPIALLDALSHGLSRALGTHPPMLSFGDEVGTRPAWLTHFAIGLVRAFWTPLGAFGLWSAFLAHWQRVARTESTDPAGVEGVQERTRSGEVQQQTGDEPCGAEDTFGN